MGSNPWVAVGVATVVVVLVVLAAARWVTQRVTDDLRAHERTAARHRADALNSLTETVRGDGEHTRRVAATLHDQTRRVLEVPDAYTGSGSLPAQTGTYAHDVAEGRAEPPDTLRGFADRVTPPQTVSRPTNGQVHVNPVQPDPTATGPIGSRDLADWRRTHYTGDTSHASSADLGDARG